MSMAEWSVAASITGGIVHALSATYGCPMHPEVTSEHPGRCSKCGMPLERQ